MDTRDRTHSPTWNDAESDDGDQHESRTPERAPRSAESASADAFSAVDGTGNGRQAHEERRRAAEQAAFDGLEPMRMAGGDLNGHAPVRDGADGSLDGASGGNGYGNGHGNGHDNGHDHSTGARPYIVPIAQQPPTRPRARLGARRRHYLMYVARSSRERRLAHNRTVARLTWASTIVLLLVIVAALASTVSAAASFYTSQQPLLASLNRKIAAQDSVRVYDATGTLLYQFNDAGAQHSIALSQIPVVVLNATVATEDHDFWTNQGVDFQAIARAALADATAGHIQEGGSTITQQLIKQNVLNSDPTFTRKIEEAILSLGMTSQGIFTKSQIIEMYLNSIPYGPTAYGIDAAATAYFSYQDNPATGETAAQHLDLAQASMLAGIPQSPVYNDPLAGSDGLQHALSRQQIVLMNMVSQGYITQQQANAAMAEAQQPGFFHPLVDQSDLAPHFVNYIRDQLDQMVTTGQLHTISRSGLNVYTTLNLTLQNQVQQYMIQHLCGYDLNDYPGSPNRLIRDDNVTNAAAIIANQHNGDIDVMLGSIDYYGKLNCHKNVDGQFNVATQGFRGPGSSFKPIVYATAFEKGWFPAMTLGNEPTVFWDAGAGTVYKPLNADNHHLTPSITVRDALQLSQNIPAVKAMQFVGVGDAEQQAMRMGITNWEGSWGLSSVLGTLNVPVIEMVQAYTVFANYGQYIPLHGINQITDALGNTLYQYQVPKPVQVMSPQVAFLITSILTDNQARAPEFGRCSVLYLDPSPADCYAHNGNSPNVWPAAVKTGTGQDLTDDWTMGYTMDYTMGVWVGNNDYSNMQWVDGVTGAAPIFYHSMLYAERSLPKRQFPVPSGVYRATYTSNGVTTTDWFVNGSTPPPNLGNTTPAACITYHPNSNSDPWDYCGLTPKPTQTPTPTPKPGG